jgi:chemotaxis signal transduction protein
MARQDSTLLLVRAAGRTVALRADDVERVLPMPALTPLPDAPEGIAGLLNLHGDVILAVDLRWRLRHGDTGGVTATDGDLSTPTAIHPSHNLVVIIAADGRTRFALWVDSAERVVEPESTGWGDVILSRDTGSTAASTERQQQPIDAANTAGISPDNRGASASTVNTKRTLLTERIVRVDGEVIPVLSTRALYPGIAVGAVQETDVT